MTTSQPGILAAVPRVGRYVTFHLRAGASPTAAIEALSKLPMSDDVVVGLGSSLVKAAGGSIEGLSPFPAHHGPGFDVPSTPAALWCWFRGADRGELVHRSRAFTSALGEGLAVDRVIDAFQFGASRDLTGYEDGTENPQGDDANAAALVKGRGAGLDGSSFVAVQQWIHDLDHFEAMPAVERDHTIGRRLSDNEELADAPPSAHVKRTAQESFDPPAFIVRRSMPWSDGERDGLVFVAFGHSVDAFDALLQRMLGRDDGVVDALFRFTRPVTGAYFWCPPVSGDRLDLSALTG